MASIFFKGPEDVSGYGDIGRCLVSALSDSLVGRADLVGKLYAAGDPDWEFYLLPLGYGDSHYPARRKGAKAAIYTMWETDWITPQQQAFLHRFDVVFVPCTWCQAVFASAGVASVVVPPFVETKTKSSSGTLVLAAGASHPPSRKRIDDTLALLEKVGVDHSVRSNDISCIKSRSPNLHLTTLTDDEQSDWFSSGKLFLSLSRSEGWGMYHHAALARGLPLVTPCFGGLADFVTPENSYIIPHTEVFAEGYFAVGMGKWSTVDLGVAEEVLRFALSDPGYEKKQKAAAASVAQFTKERMRRELLAALI